MKLRKRGGAGAAVLSTKGTGRSGRVDEERELIRQARLSAAARPGRKPSSVIRAGGGYANAPAATALRRRSPAAPRMLALMGAAALVVAAAAFVLVTLQQKPALARGEQVFFDGRALCIVQDRAVAEDAMEKIQDDLKRTYGMDIRHNGALSYESVLCDDRYILDRDEALKALKANIDAKVVATVILVNDRPSVALKTQQEAQQALDQVLAPYRDAPADRYRTDIAFVEQVTVEQMPIDYAQVQELGDAVRTLTLGSGVDDNFYTVAKGDSLARIARKFKLKVSDLKKANPALSISDMIQPGQTLNAVKPENWINIRYTETLSRQEALPFETVEQQDASLYSTQKKTQQEGKNGLREVVAKVTYINGMEAMKQILSQTVLEAARDRIVMRGTKKVPANAGSGGVVAGGKFIKPMKSYTVTSVFKKRTLEGVTRWHYGYDLAAPTGTPIYATASGTVSYSGSASGYGLVVYLDHGGGIQSRYGHCSKLLVKKGQKVTQGQIIALVGSTGHSTGPHCHFEIREHGTPVDPAKYVRLK